MATQTKPGRSDQEYDDVFNSMVEQYGYDEKFNNITKGLDAAESNGSNNPDTNTDSDSLDQKEANGSSAANQWINNTKSKVKDAAKKKGVKLLRRKGVVIGTLGGSSVLAGAAFVFFVLAFMPVFVADELNDQNDVVSASIQRRSMKVVQNMLTTNKVCSASAAKGVTCKTKRISNKALRSLQKSGITAIFKDGSRYNGTTKDGFPTNKPTEYEIDIGDGNKRTISANTLATELSDMSTPERRKLTNHVLGFTGAFKLKLRTYSGKALESKLLSKIGIIKDGGILGDRYKDIETDSSNKSSALKKVKAKVTKAVEESSITKKVGEGSDWIKEKANTKISGKITVAKAGGIAYTGAVIACTGVKLPGYIAAAYASVQLAQISSLTNDILLSPSSKMKASFIAEDFDADAGNQLSSALTEKTPRESDGKKTSALDSPILQYALGINDNRPAVSEAFAPGYKALTSSLVLNAESVANNPGVEGVCNTIMNPVAMYAAMAVDAATTIALSSTVVGGVAKVVISAAASEIGGQVAMAALSGVATQIITDLAKNNKVPEAEGEALGDILGLGALGIYGSAGAARNLPVMKTSQLSASAAVFNETKQMQKEMELADLSPFDITSKYTFLGSIMRGFSFAMIKNGTYSSSMFSVAKNILSFGSLAKSSLSSATTVSAQSVLEADRCGYAKDFGLETDDPIGINAAGLGCTGLTPEQAAMSTDEAASILIDEGWVDDSVEVADDATVDQLLETGAVRKNTPLADYITNCSDPASGDYLLNAAGCTVPTNIPKSTGELSGSCKTSACPEDTEGYGDSAYVPAKNGARAYAAMATFLLDFQAAQMINGQEDIDESTAAQNEDAAAASGDVVGDKARPLPKGSSTATTYPGHKGVDFGAPAGTPIYSVAAGRVETVDLAQSTTWGIYIKIDHGGTKSLYAHIKPGTAKVKVGDTVKAGQQIAGVGNTGRSFGSHLHFEIWQGNTRTGSQASFNWLKKYNILPKDQSGML